MSEQNLPAVEGPVDCDVRPRAWACVWPDTNGCGGGVFMTIDERTARNYVYQAAVSEKRKGRECVPKLEPLYDQFAFDALFIALRTIRAGADDASFVRKIVDDVRVLYGA